MPKTVFPSSGAKGIPLVSIIIPTYNRAHLIGETLDSVFAQTYTNWECIIVDDGSTDHTDEVVGKYLERDRRFKYYHRPDEHLPGGNGARNFGFKMSRGDYIQWFDSDDLMMPEKLAVKVKAMLENSVDFVVSRTKYFNAPKSEKDYLYNFDETQVNFESFTTTFISWYTPDFFVCRNAVLNTYFNEDLQSGQEFNFIAKVLINYDKCKIIKQNLTLRRYTSDSIGVSRRQSKTEFQRTTFENSWITFNEVYPLSGFNKSFGQKLLLKCMKAYVEIRDIQKPNRFFMEIVKFYNFKAIYFFLSLISFRLFSKYVYFFKKLR